MPIFDIVIFSLIIFPAVIGIFYGFFNMMLSLLSWMVALAISIHWTPYFSGFLKEYIDTPILKIMLAFIGLFILSLLIISSLSYLLLKLLNSAGLTMVDRISGFLLGIGIGQSIVFMIVFLAGFTTFPQESWWDESRLVGPFEYAGHWSTRFLPESLIKYHSYEYKK